MSAGNFGKSFAFLCAHHKFPALVLLPETAPEDRTELIARYGARVARYPVSELQARCERYAQEEHMVYVHPFDDPLLFSGYASVGLELAEQIQEQQQQRYHRQASASGSGTAADARSADLVVVGIGGGGFISGVALALARLGEQGLCGTRVIGVEPEGAPAMHQSLAAGSPQTLSSVKTIASGLGAPFAGQNAFEHVRLCVDRVVLVSDEEIRAAMRLCFEHLHLVVEPAGAAALAAVLFDRLGVDLQKTSVVCVVSGGNISAQQLAQLVTSS
mmetsp:Transcript_439/g.1272  ORF Transcript_439/g.1272 Transcript_439/m.1272 type:complete len:273 (+) Transcript_439:3120-3938(+)